MSRTILVADLKPDIDPQHDYFAEGLRFEGGAWDRIAATIRELGVLDAETMTRLASPVARMEVTQEQARKIGTALEVWLAKDALRRRQPPNIPSYIVPIATSNGLWIDPALPLLHRPLEWPTDLFEFASFCEVCQGFSVN